MEIKDSWILKINDLKLMKKIEDTGTLAFEEN